VRRVIRQGHVRRVEPGRLAMDEGEAELAPGALVIDCAASAATELPSGGRVFEPGRINLEMVRPYQPTFSSALIARLEATVDDLEVKRAATRATPLQDTPKEWVERRLTGAMNEAAWSKIEAVNAWMKTSRLNATSHTLAGFDPSDAAQAGLMARIGAAMPRAVENMARLIA